MAGSYGPKIPSRMFRWRGWLPLAVSNPVFRRPARIRLIRTRKRSLAAEGLRTAGPSVIGSTDLRTVQPARTRPRAHLAVIGWQPSWLSAARGSHGYGSRGLRVGELTYTRAGTRTARISSVQATCTWEDRAYFQALTINVYAFVVLSAGLEWSVALTVNL
jgi:hypothetical protein